MMLQRFFLCLVIEMPQQVSANFLSTQSIHALTPEEVKII